MNIPVKNIVLDNIPLSKIYPKEVFLDLHKKKFSGYFYVVAKTEVGFEESVIIFDNGDVSASLFYEDYYNIEIHGKSAFYLGVNSLCAQKGTFSLVELSREQIRLLLIFNEKINFEYKINSKNVSKLEFRYNKDMLNKFIDLNEDNLSKSDLFKRFNLTELLRS